MLQIPDHAALFEASPYPYLLVDRELVIIGANPAYLQATGRTAQELMGKHIFDAFPPNAADPDSTNIAEVRASIEIAISSRKPHTSTLLRYAVPRTTATGTRFFEDRYWSAIHSPVFDAQGEVAFVAQNALDVTDLYQFDPETRRYHLRQGADAVPDAPSTDSPRTQAAMARILRDERNQLQLLFDQAPGFIAVLSGDTHAFTMANEAFYGLVGRRELVGRPLLEAMPEMAGQGWLELLDQALASGRPIVKKEHPVLLRRQSGMPPEEIYIDVVFQPIRGPDGRVTGIFSQGHEVTQAFRARRALAQKVRELEEARSRQAFQLQLADTFKAVSAPGEIMQRACALVAARLGARRVAVGDHDASSRSVTFHASHAEGAVQPLAGTFAAADFGAGVAASLEDGTPWRCEDLAAGLPACSPSVRADFETQGIGAAMLLPLAHDGAVVACMFIDTAAPRPWSADDIALARDAAERMWSAVGRARAEEALRQADRRKDEFLAMLAHELRNPLAPISAAAALLKMSGLPPASIARTSDVIARQVKHMTGLVDDLLDVSRVSTGLVVLDRLEVDLRQVVDDAVEQARPLIASRRHQISTRHAAGDAVVSGDHKRLVQVIANLLTNAAKYTPEGGTIAVAVDATPQWVSLSVRDNGVGIESELQPHVFTLFTQAERTPDRGQGGLGLGLALVRSLVELHGGSVGVRSAGAGAGSEFTVRLPRASRSPPVDAAQAQAPQADAATRVMVVDDNVDAANMLAMLLQTKGFSVDVAYEPQQALEQASESRYDAFLLDIGLPGMDGNELARRLRTIPTARGSALIAITGYGGRFDRETSLRAGFDHYLTKPADAENVLAALGRLTRRQLPH